MFFFPQESPDLPEAKKAHLKKQKKLEPIISVLLLFMALPMEISRNKSKGSFHVLAIFYLVMILMHIFLIMYYFHFMSLKFPVLKLIYL